jgi:hypothetical protein
MKFSRQVYTPRFLFIELLAKVFLVFIHNKLSGFVNIEGFNSLLDKECTNSTQIAEQQAGRFRVTYIDRLPKVNENCV